MKKVFLTVLLALAAALPVRAQTAGSDEPYRFELGFNPMSYLHQFGTNLWGGSFSLTMRRSERVHYVADLSIHQKGGTSPYAVSAYRFGLRYYAHARGKLTPFGEALAGGANLSSVTTTVGTTTTSTPSHNGVAFAVGGGADYFIRPWLSWRVLQADYSLMRAGGDTSNGVRIHTGAVFHFGH